MNSIKLIRHRFHRVISTFCVLSLLVLSGCERASESIYVLNDQSNEFDTKLRVNIRRILDTHSGTPQSPKMLGEESFAVAELKQGVEIYNRRCVQCHGVTGDGNGPVAKYLYPRPRDYRKGLFKFTTTQYGTRPRREDLIRTLKRGIPGTSMPSFARLSQAELEAVADYVIALSRRGELENLLVLEADPDEPEFDPEIVQEFVDQIAQDWKMADYNIVTPLTPMPEFTAEDVAVGRELFTSEDIGCLKCHGADGRGQTAANVVTPLKDVWGHDARAADLTSGIFRGGSEPIDIYRRIYNGINGTPMPGFGTSQKIRDDPELLWKLVAYVLTVSGERRSGTVPPVGEFTFAPYPIGAKVDKEKVADEE